MPAAESKTLLIGNTFPMSLIRRRVEIEPVSMTTLGRALEGKCVASFWGHVNTLAAASAHVGVDLTPRAERPSLHLNNEDLPSLDGKVFDECWVLSPNYTPGFRPAIGEEVAPIKISAWQVLRISWRIKSVGR
jgi:hypothetical protein